MRYQGKITDWKDDRGFGFITQNSSNTKVFVHISAFARGQKRPAVNELVTYECIKDEKRGFCAADVQYVQTANQPHKPARGAYAKKQGLGIFTPLIVVLLAVGGGVYAWQNATSTASESYPVTESVGIQRLAEPLAPTSNTPAFQCQGKQFCSQMTSCAEATYYQKNCPDTQMDGDNDGVPCESQWCG